MMTGKSAQWLGGGLLLALVSIAVWRLGSGTPAARDAEAPASTATIARTTLLDARTQTGTLGFGAPVDVPFINKERSGIVTWMAPEGTMVARGEPLFAIDGQPVILFYGELPFFRTLRFGGESFGEFEWLELNNAEDDQRKAELNLALQQARLAEADMKLKVARDKLRRTEQLRERGFTTPADTDQVRAELADADVALLRKNLAALGYEGAAEDAVRRWQAATGHSASGLIKPGQIIVAPGPVRVADHLAESAIT